MFKGPSLFTATRTRQTKTRSEANIDLKLLHLSRVCALAQQLLRPQNEENEAASCQKCVTFDEPTAHGGRQKAAIVH